MDIILRIKNFAKSLAFHIWRGFPKCTKEEIEERYKICNACSDFLVEESVCGICYCNISKKKEFFNKLAWSDQQCPVGKWQQINRRK